jgi:hypothetical protein
MMPGIAQAAAAVAAGKNNSSSNKSPRWFDIVGIDLPDDESFDESVRAFMEKIKSYTSDYLFPIAERHELIAKIIRGWSRLRHIITSTNDFSCRQISVLSILMLFAKRMATWFITTPSKAQSTKIVKIDGVSCNDEDTTDVNQPQQQEQDHQSTPSGASDESNPGTPMDNFVDSSIPVPTKIFRRLSNASIGFFNASEAMALKTDHHHQSSFALDEYVNVIFNSLFDQRRE